LGWDGITGAYLIMDKVKFHKTEFVGNLIESHGHHAVFLPPYSPFLNPIEELFSQWKGIVRRSEPNSEDELYIKVHNSSELITPENCANYFKHMERYIIRCLKKDVIEY
jgi:transposase